jgi:hypothetical protein
MYPFLAEHVRPDPSGIHYQLAAPDLDPTEISAQWLEIPKSAKLGNGTKMTEIPSAFIGLSLPFENSTDNGPAVFLCSVTSRWASGTYHGGPVGDGTFDFVQTVTVDKKPLPTDLAQTGYYYAFDTSHDGSWRMVEMDLTWLETLTPRLNDSNPNRSTLSGTRRPRYSRTRLRA